MTTTTILSFIFFSSLCVHAIVAQDDPSDPSQQFMKRMYVMFTNPAAAGMAQPQQQAVQVIPLQYMTGNQQTADPYGMYASQMAQNPYAAMSPYAAYGGGAPMGQAAAMQPAVQQAAPAASGYSPISFLFGGSGGGNYPILSNLLGRWLRSVLKEMEKDGLIKTFF